MDLGIQFMDPKTSRHSIISWTLRALNWLPRRFLCFLHKTQITSSTKSFCKDQENSNECVQKLKYFLKIQGNVIFWHVDYHAIQKLGWKENPGLMGKKRHGFCFSQNTKSNSIEQNRTVRHGKFSQLYQKCTNFLSYKRF